MKRLDSLPGRRRAGTPKPGARLEKREVFWKRLPRWARITGCVTLALIAVVSALALSLRLYVRLPQPDPDVTLPPPSGTPTVLPSGTLPTERPGDQEIVPPKVMTARDNVYSFLLVGAKDGMTDTLMVALLDLNAMTLDIISIPRDTLIETDLRSRKINALYGAKDQGISALREEMGELLGFVPASYAVVNMKGFETIVDKLGGVYFDVPIDMYVEWENIDLKAGYQPLNGEKALMLMRFRGYDEKTAGPAGVSHSDFGRMQMQQKFLSVLAKEMLSLKHILKLPDIATTMAKNLSSNLDAGQMAGVGEQLLRLRGEDIHFYTLPTDSVYHKGSAGAPGEWYEQVRTAEVLELVNRTVNPYTDDITEDMVSHSRLADEP